GTIARLTGALQRLRFVPSRWRNDAGSSGARRQTGTDRAALCAHARLARPRVARPHSRTTSVPGNKIGSRGGKRPAFAEGRGVTGEIRNATAESRSASSCYKGWVAECREVQPLFSCSRGIQRALE